MLLSQSIAGHHPECGYPFDRCVCIQLHQRDRAEKDELDDSYREYWDPDWGTED